MPCEWMHKDPKMDPSSFHPAIRDGPFGFWLIVLGEVMVPPPYAPEGCVGNGAALMRVQKVLGATLEKLERAKQQGYPQQ